MLVPRARTSGNVTSMAAAVTTAMTTFRIRKKIASRVTVLTSLSLGVPESTPPRSDSSKTEISAMSSQPKPRISSSVAAWRTAGATPGWMWSSGCTTRPRNTGRSRRRGRVR
jgi:hypothetical protein